MLRKLTEKLSLAAASVWGNDKVNRLTAMGFDSTQASNALEACNGNVDQAAELLLAQAGLQQQQHPTTTTTTTTASQRTTPRDNSSSTDATMERVLRESIEAEERRSANELAKVQAESRSAASIKAGEAALRRAANGPNGKATRTTATTSTTARSTNNKSSTATKAAGAVGASTVTTGPLVSHPDVKIIPTLQDKSKEEQILRCADRLKAYPQAVDTLHRALVSLQQNADNAKFRKIDKQTAGYQRSLANVPGAEDMLRAMNYRSNGPHELVLDRFMVDPALLYLGVSALEQTQQTPVYREAKQRALFVQQLRQIRAAADSSENEAIQRAAYMAKCPTEPTAGRGALMQVVMADETVRRRFDGDDTLADVVHWLGGHGTAIVDKINSREWSLIDTNRYPLVPIDCQANWDNTLQYIGCWPSGRLEIVPSIDEWTQQQGQPTNGNSMKPGSSRGLGAAPSDAL